jgi:dTDP-glucose pyrophosphorylase/predicted transcriptional regulator
MKNWKGLLLSPEASIRKAIEVINASGLQIALVVDQENCLLGTVTDGDIRRAILNGRTIEENVSEIMCENPSSALEQDTKSDLLSLMKRKSLRQIPILDQNKQVVGLENWANLMHKSTQDNVVVLMAGGLGTRLRPLTEDTPKPLLKVGTKPILETIILGFMEYGFDKFQIAVNYQSEKIKDYFQDGAKWGATITYIEETQRLGTAGALSLLPNIPDKPFFVMNGDLLTRINYQHLLDFHEDHNSSATMCVREYDYQIPYGVVNIDEHNILGIEEKPVHRFFVNAGIYVLNPKVIKLLPENTNFDMPDLFDKLIETKQITSAFPVHEYWMDIGQVEDFRRANGEFNTKFNI